MSAKTSPLREMIEGLQKSLAFHQDRERFHAEQQAHHASKEKLHADERARHAAEIEAATRHLEELQGMAARLDEVITRTPVVPPETDEQVLGRRPNLSIAMDRVLATWPLDVPFSASILAAEIKRRYGAILRRTVDVRAVGSALRRRRDKKLLREVREGRPFGEAQYRKVG
ncbi:MAG TPA: hypothetical protein VGX68_29935 [Thermoanaerobaculia bacterium]|jgi:hypothetical protein|nr:hypothetical protein [Thermoanaerobaculia bacterium]